MTFHPTDRLGLFIDGADLYPAARGLSLDIDYKKLSDELFKHGVLVRAYYYTGMFEDQEYSPIRPLIDWLDYNGFALVTKPVKRWVDAATGQNRTKGDTDVESAVDMLQMAAHLDEDETEADEGD